MGGMTGRSEGKRKGGGGRDARSATTNGRLKWNILPVMFSRLSRISRILQEKKLDFST